MSTTESINLESLGLDYNRNISSKSIIKSGINRGYRKKETSGTWISSGGYCYESRQDVKAANYCWAKALLNLGFRVGKQDYDGAVNFYIFQDAK